MNFPYISSTLSGKYYIATTAFRGGCVRLSGFFKTKAAAEKKLEKLRREFGPSFGCN